MPGDDVRTAVREAIDQVYSDGSASTREAATAALRSICTTERRGSSRSSFTAATAELAN
jgi:hypothetical protein